MSDATSPHDLEHIPDEAELWRRIPYRHWVPDDRAQGGRRVSSAAFDDPELSVVVAGRCEGGLDTLLRGHHGFGVAAFTAGFARELGCQVSLAPDDQLPGHAHVLGPQSRSQLKKLARQLATKCRILREPDSRSEVSEV